MTGSSIFDYVHHSDHAEIAEQLGLSLSTSVGSGMSSPHSVHSDDPSTSHGTNNPDGKSMSFLIKIFKDTCCFPDLHHIL